MSLWRALCSQPIHTVSLSAPAWARSFWICSLEGVMQRVRQTDTHSPQSAHRSQSLARLGRLNTSSP